MRCFFCAEITETVVAFGLASSVFDSFAVVVGIITIPTATATAIALVVTATATATALVVTATATATALAVVALVPVLAIACKLVKKPRKQYSKIGEGSSLHLF